MARTRDLFDDIIEVLERRRLKGETRVSLSQASRDILFTPPESPPSPVRDSGSRAPAPEPVRDRPAAPVPRPSPPADRPVLVPAATVSTEPVSDASVPGTWEDLARAVEECRKCPLAQGRLHAVFGEGAADADLMFIGEGPGTEEDRMGRPFVGHSGELLTRMIAAMQFTREQVYIANIVKCHPPGNRNPRDTEAAACLPYLIRQIELVSPKILVLLGAVPLKILLELSPLTQHRGTWLSFRGIPTMPTFHPAFLLRYPKRKGEAWQDLQQVMLRLGKDPSLTPRGGPSSG